MSAQNEEPHQPDVFLEDVEDEQEDDEILGDETGETSFPEFHISRFVRSKWYKKRSLVLISLTSILGFSLILLAIWIYIFTSARMILFMCGGGSAVILLLIGGFILFPVIWWLGLLCWRLRGQGYVKLEKPVDQKKWWTYMKRGSVVLRWVCTVLGVLAVILLIIVLGFWIFLQIETSPRTSGTLFFSGLQHPVKIVREKSGVIHIYAQNDHDMYFAQGVAQAQERLWQMEFQRRLGAGRLSEIVGKDALEYDKLTRTVGFYNASSRALKYYSSETLANMQAFVDGINAYLDTNPGLPLEFYIFGHKPEKWKLEDVVVWAKMMSWDLSNNVKKEMKRFQLLQNGLSVQRINELLPIYPDWGAVVLSKEALKLNVTREEELENMEKFTKDNAAYIPQPKTPNSKTLTELPSILNAGMGASNNWVIHGSKTKSGLPLLCDDPHLLLMSPGIWLLMHLQSNQSGMNAIGTSFAGLPGIVIGRNDHIAWGVTNVGADNQDLYVLSESSDGKSYSYKGSMVDYTIRKEVIRVKGEEDVVLDVKESVYGPVLDESVPYALRWVSLDDVDNTMEAFVGISKAKNWDEFREAFRGYVAPSQNFIFADYKTGDIGYISPGKIPIRKVGHSGRFPVSGNGDWDWEGFIPFEELPQVLNPPENYIVSANNPNVPWGYKYSIALDWEAPFRASRITELVKQKDDFTVQDMIDIQMDVKSLLFEKLSFVFSKLNGKLTGDYELWRKRLESWDGVESADSQEATVFEKWWIMLGELTTPHTQTPLHDPTYLIKVFSTDSDPACDAHKMTCLDFAAQSFQKAIDKIYSEFGTIPPWGQIHKYRFDHPILGKSILGCLASREVYALGGAHTVNVAHDQGETYVSVAGPSYRMIVDAADPEKSLFIAAPGSSGNILSYNYENWLSLWKDGKYLEMKLENYEIDGEQELKPK